VLETPWYIMSSYRKKLGYQYEKYEKCGSLGMIVYGLEACPLVKSDLLSLDFVVNRFFMKLFKTNNIDVVKTCQQYFEMPSTLWRKRSASFDFKFSSSENSFCKITSYSF